MTKQELELIEAARSAISKNYDKENFNHTVGAAVLCGSGRIYTGINCYSLHGICAEQTAIGTAMTNGEREFLCIVAVRGECGEEILPPCGNCRQMLCDYMPDCKVILAENGDGITVTARELLPYAYAVE